MHVSFNDFSDTELPVCVCPLQGQKESHVFIIGWKITFFFSFPSFVRTVYLKVVRLEALQLLSISSYQTLWKVLSSRSLSCPQRAWGTAATSLTLPRSTQVLTNDSNKVMIWCKFLSAALPPCTEQKALNYLVPSKFLHLCLDPDLNICKEKNAEF